VSTALVMNCITSECVLRRQVWWQRRGNSCGRLGWLQRYRASKCSVHVVASSRCRESCCCNCRV